MVRPTTPERAAAATVGPPTPEVTRRLEESRLRSKAIRGQREANGPASPSQPRTTSGLVNTNDIQLAGPNGRKRPFSAIVDPRIKPTPTTASTSPSASSRTASVATHRDARNTDGEGLKPARKFTKFVDYNFSAMTDTKGGFLNTEDDPWSKSMAAPAGASGQEVEQKPAHMTAAEWERLQLIRNLKRQKQGPFEPGLSVLADEKERKKCRECASLEIDFAWEETFGCAVCNLCKEKFPDKYSLLTKTECREDYLLTEPELRDPDLLPHLSKPNPHKSHWHDMMLFLRYQVEEYAFNQKWGSADALDAEFQKRQEEKKKRKEAKFKEKLLELKRKTRTDAYRRNTGKLADAGGKATKFGDAVGGSSKHIHEWGRTVDNEHGMTVKECLSCGIEVEEVEL